MGAEPGSAWFALGAGNRVSFDGCLIRRGAGPYLLPQLERTVASVCDLCGKGPGFGNNVSHSHRRTRRRWNPNVQRVRAMVGGTPKRLYVCTSCIKAGRITR
jgi:large subunit ribosomal protein L28